MAFKFDLGAVTAYSVAVQNGYEGTIEEWAKAVADVVGLQTDVSRAVDEAKSEANKAKGSASTAQNYSDNVTNAISTIASRISPPISVSSASAMSDTTKIYVYTGSESGYVNGHWYYYYGTQWVDGGVYEKRYDYDDLYNKPAIVVVDDEEPSDSRTPVWFDPTGEEIEVPTMSEFNALVARVEALEGND